MLFTTRSFGAGAFAVTADTAPTQPPPQPPQPPKPQSPSPPTVMTMYVCPDGTRVSDLSACPKPLMPLRFDPAALTKQPVSALSFTCTTDACTGTGTADFVFRLLQNLINMANVQLARTGAAAAPITVDGKLDKRTLAAYMPVSRGIGGSLAIFDFSPDPKYLATNAMTFAQTIAQWLNVTWVAATALMAGHWERLRVGGTTVLPTPSTTAPPTPGQPSPPTVMTMYVCPDGTRVSDLSACPKPQAQLVECVPPPQPSPGSQVSPSYWDSYNACLQQGGKLPSQSQPPSQPQTYQCPGGRYVQALQTCPDGAGYIDANGQYQAQREAQPVQVPPHTYGLEPPPGTLPFPGTITPPASKRYAGCLARFNKTRKVFAIYCPIGTAPTTVSPGLAAYSGFRGYDDEQFRCLYGNCGGLGADTVTPLVPANFIKTAETRALPGEGETPAGEEKDKFFRANNPIMWLTFVGVAAAIGGGSYWVIRRRRAA